MEPIVASDAAVKEVGLYIVSTPIGHLGDMTFRALQVLREVSLIAAEDTRTAQKLLRAHGMHRPLMSLYRDNEAQRAEQVVERLQAGESIALISEAGTPCISDPGYVLVRAVVEAGFPVFPIPGASAVIAALSASGLPTHHFSFLGFLPTKSGRRKKAIQPYRSVPGTLVLYESPHRLIALLRDLIDELGDRPACVAREMTKLYEEFVRGSLHELIEIFEARDAVRGECVVMVRGRTDESGEEWEGIESVGPTEQGVSSDDPMSQVRTWAHELLESGARQSKLARQLTSTFPFLSRKDAYRILQECKEEASVSDGSDD